MSVEWRLASSTTGRVGKMLRNTPSLCLAVMLAMAIPLAGCSRQQSDWQKTRETNTADAYEQFLKKYPTGEFTAQAQARVKELYEERDWQKARDADTPEAYQAFLKQYPEGKWTEEARIRVENFTLAQASGSTTTASGTTAPTGADSGSPPADGSDTAPATTATPPAATPGAECGPDAHCEACGQGRGCAGGILWHSARRIQIGRVRRPRSLDEFAGPVPDPVGRFVVEGIPERHGGWQAVSLAVLRSDGKACAGYLPLSRREVASLPGIAPGVTASAGRLAAARPCSLV